MDFTASSSFSFSDGGYETDGHNRDACDQLALGSDSMPSALLGKIEMQENES
jgi:hypothetical protein